VEEGEESPLKEQLPLGTREEEQLTEEEEISATPSYPNSMHTTPPPILACDDVEANNFEVQP